MFWYLLFAHFLADYPLQSNWIVEHKNRPGVLILHILTHLFVSLIVVIFIAPRSWPYILLLTAIHLLIDTGKSTLNKVKPQWVVVPYFVDQFLHILSIAVIAGLMEPTSGISPFELRPLWLIGLLVYLVVTYVWYISERIISSYNQSYFQQVVNSEWSRMFARAFFLTFFLILLSNFRNENILILGMSAFPYRRATFGMRALFIDILIAITGALFIFTLV
ncbi:MAG: DUF3307 domain-containing protein [Chloroflexota bacterium]|nr:MAG: DUF3307 domain-containing protein [Chloroflexota bacterium]